MDIDLREPETISPPFTTLKKYIFIYFYLFIFIYIYIYIYIYLFEVRLGSILVFSNLNSYELSSFLVFSFFFPFSFAFSYCISLKKKNTSARSDVMDNAQLVVNSVHITIQTLGGALLMIDLDDILIQSTNGSWQVCLLFVLHLRFFFFVYFMSKFEDRSFAFTKAVVVFRW